MGLPVLIDTDPGVDDALALLVALASRELDVRLITTVAGNTDVANTTRNAGRVLAVARPASWPPVARGAERPREGPPRSATSVHGVDGLGDLGEGVYPPAAEWSPVAEPAAEALVRVLRGTPGAVLVTLGPLTNIAEVLARDRHAFDAVREVIIMGGAIAEPGNVTPVAEFNIFADPLAAREVLRAGLPVTLVPLDVTHRVVLSDERMESMPASRGTPAARFVRDITRGYIEFHRAHFGISGCYAHDPLAMAVAIDPTLVQSEPMVVDVETEGTLTRGMTVADRRTGLRTAAPNVRVAMAVDAERAVGLITGRLG